MRVQSSKGLIASELKYPWRWELFLRKVKEGLPFTTIDGGEVRIPGEGNDHLISALVSRSQPGYTRAFRQGVAVVRDGSTSTLHSAGILHKSADFGGKTAGHGLAAQRRQTEELRAALLVAGGGRPVPVFMGDKVVYATDVVELGGRCKADVALVDPGGCHVARLSLKSARCPGDMQQWSGVAEFAREPEVRDFVAAVDGLPRSELPVCRSLGSERIRRDALYGSGDGRADAVVAVDVCALLPRIDGVFSLAGRVHYYPEVPPEGSGWEPVLLARRSTSRRDQGVDGVRLGVFPRAGRRARVLP